MIAEEKRLVVTGFLSDDGASSYRKLSGLNWGFPRVERTRDLLAKRNIVPQVDYERLRTALQTDVLDLKRQYPEITCLAIATPGLEVLTREEVEATELEIYGQINMLVRYCVEHGYNHIGLLGTEWDVCAESPLVRALGQNQIGVYTPNPEHCASVSVCATTALKAYLQLHGRILDSSDYCTEAVDYMIHRACGTMEALVICNPELRALMPLLKSKRKQFFATTEIIDLPSLYWSELAKRISQPQEKTSS